MGRYLYLGQYAPEGIRGLVAEGGTSREAETRAVFQAVGGSVEAYQFCVGSDIDFVIIADVPDAVAAIVPPLLAESSGTVSVRTLPLLSASDLDRATATAREVGFRAAGT